METLLGQKVVAHFPCDKVDIILHYSLFYTFASNNINLNNMWSWIKKHIGIIGGIFTFLSTIFFIYTAFFPFEKKSKIIFYEKTVQDVFSWKDTIDGLEIHCN